MIQLIFVAPMKKIIVCLYCFMICVAGWGQPAYDMQKLQRERLNRGVVAIRQADGRVAVSWRLLAADGVQAAFSVYRNGQLMTAEPLTTGGTFWVDGQPVEGDAVYEVRGGSMDGQYTLKAGAPVGYLPIKVDKPQGGMTPSGEAYDYTACDATIGDVDGDGQYEIFLLWNPTNAHDNSHGGYTGNVLIDCYRLEGQRLWRVDLGQNIRAGAHYTQLMVYDFDGDGRAEMMCKTADGTIDGVGRVIGNASKDWRNHDQVSLGRVLKGPEYLSVFDGLTGRALATADYIPSRGRIQDWGDGYGNRVDRFLAAVAYLDGRHASAVFCRGYYTRTVVAAWDWDGRRLRSRWMFDTNEKRWADYAGQGNHNLRVADVDGDGCDEIVYGSMCVDHDGTGLYNTGFGHGDAIHLVPDHESGALLIWDCHENHRDGVDLRDGKTGRVIFQRPSPMDVGRCMAADIDPEHDGYELWSIASREIYNIKGEVVRQSIGGRFSYNFGIWWDGDLLRELLDHETVTKYDWKHNRCYPLMRFEGCRFNNHTKSNPCLSADMLGDWREEVLTRTADNTELRLYVSTIPTDYRLTCLEEDIPYRLSVATENVGYNQPPEPGIFIGVKR